MSNITKYRVHEVAKDFGLPSKKVAEIMADYFEAPKNHMQALTDEELNLIFDKITATHQVESIEVIFAQAVPSAPPKETPAAAQEPAAAAPSPEDKPTQAPASPPEQKTAVPAAEKPPAPAAVAPAAPVPPPAPIKGRTTRVIDTRGVAAVDLGKYDEKLERLASERTSQMVKGKEKIKRAPDKKSGPGGFSQKRRQEEQERMRRLQLEALKKQPIKVSIPDELSVGELAIMLKKTGAEVVKRLMKLGVMASLSQIIDFDTASLVALEFGAKVERQVVVTIEERLIDDSADTEENLVPRDPVVVVMGHVDHGKTSLLDYIRHSAVAAGEHGGITQHIGAYRLPVNGKHIAFLDTPGHEAFTSMRMRGASMTDIAILVVAADDGIKPQTVEAISHARSAEIPIIVAINKMDKPEANPDRIMQQLTEHELLPEAWGGDTIVCQVSAKTGMGIDNLMEMVLLTAEMQGLKANPNRTAKGAVVEAKLDKGRGPVATVLVQNGTLKQGDILIAGMTVGRVRAMADERGHRLETAGPSVPVEIVGLSEVPQAGDQFHAVGDERMARELVEQRKQQQKDEASRPALSKVSLDDLFAQIQEGQIKDLNLVIKADVHGSVEALKASLEKLSNPEVRVRVIHSAVGAVTESDILLATTASAIIIGFNVRIDSRARESADRSGVDIRLYRVIYEAIEEMEAAMKGLLAPQYKEVTLGQAEVRQIFRASGIGTIAGCHVVNGKIARNASVRLVRDGIVVMDGAIASLKRFKDDAREVMSGYECGISLEKFNDIKEGDIIEAYAMEEIAR